MLNIWGNFDLCPGYFLTLTSIYFEEQTFNSVVLVTEVLWTKAERRSSWFSGHF